MSLSWTVFLWKVCLQIAKAEGTEAVNDTVGEQEPRTRRQVQVEVEPETGAQPSRSSILDATGPGTEGRPRRAGDLGHLLPISGNSRNVQVRSRSTWPVEDILFFNREFLCCAMLS
jgi:hypothetical protein